ncbi:retinol-binding protein pinta-like [Linepithema humile]|uniref:retinol-binding protein pinta-like n=1 Tax=Linepithema humile TaxID=83485 RepID=UPI0006234247|nr:PREDICTED: alpha-tocopherol transfer protein-like [Linepithema humile]
MTDPRSCRDCVSRKLTIEEKEYAAANLNETDENREKAITHIRHWIQENDDLCARTDDFFILRFLRVCKFDIEKTKTRIRNYYKQRFDLPEWFANKDPLRPELQDLLDEGLFLPLRKLDDQKRMVIFSRVGRQNPSTQKLSDFIKICNMTMEVFARNHVEGSIYGYVAYTDFDLVHMGHISQMRPNIIRNFIYTWQDCFPLEIQSINFINTPACAHAVLRIVKYFLNENLRQKVHTYTKKMMQNCFNDIPADILPVEYGGTGGTIVELKEYWKKVLGENRDWIIDDEKYKLVSKEK